MDRIASRRAASSVVAPAPLNNARALPQADLVIGPPPAGGPVCRPGNGARSAPGDVVQDRVAVVGPSVDAIVECHGSLWRGRWCAYSSAERAAGIPGTCPQSLWRCMI